MPRVEIIVNAGGGSFVEGETETALADAFAEAGVDAKVTLIREGSELAEAARRSDADIIAAAGGDGTISAIASVAIERDKTFAALPLGTLNHFAKDIGIPQDVSEAARVVAAGYVTRVDAGEVNGQIFINNSSIGLYPHMVLRREKQQQTLGRGKWRAAFSAALQVLRRRPFFRVEMHIDGKLRVHQTPFVFIGNNEYAMDVYNIGTRERLDGGKLSVYFMRRGGRWGVIRMLAHTIFGTLDQMKEFEQLSVEEVTINMRSNTVLVAHDGEVSTMDTPLKYRILPKALQVIVPQETAE